MRWRVSLGATSTRVKRAFGRGSSVPCQGCEKIGQVVRQVVVQRRQVGLESDGLAAVHQRLRGPTQVEQHLAEVGLRRREGRIGLDRAAEVAQGLVRLAIIAQEHAERIMDCRAVRPVAQRLPQFLGGLLRAPETVQCQADVVACVETVGTEARGRAAALNRTLEVALRPVHFGQIGMKRRRPGIERDGAADQVDGPSAVGSVREVRDGAVSTAGLPASGTPHHWHQGISMQWPMSA